MFNKTDPALHYQLVIRSGKPFLKYYWQLFEHIFHEPFGLSVDRQLALRERALGLHKDLYIYTLNVMIIIWSFFHLFWTKTNNWDIIPNKKVLSIRYNTNRESIVRKYFTFLYDFSIYHYLNTGLSIYRCYWMPDHSEHRCVWIGVCDTWNTNYRNYSLIFVFVLLQQMNCYNSLSRERPGIPVLRY